MAKPALTLRSVKGAALTFNEMDTNLGNLANAVIQVSAGGTTSNIDLNSGFEIADSATVTATLAGNVITLTGANPIDLSVPDAIGSAVPNAGHFTDLYIYSSLDAQNNEIKNAYLRNVKETVYDLGNVSGTVSIDAENGSIQTMTVTNAITINQSNLSNFDSGETVSLRITQATNTNVRTLTSDLKFAGGIKTLTAANAAIDTMHITYDGTNYLVALVKGYA